MTSPITAASSMNKKNAASKTPAAYSQSNVHATNSHLPSFANSSSESFLRLPLSTAAAVGLLSNAIDRPDVLQSLAAQTTASSSSAPSSSSGAGGSSAALPPHPHAHSHNHLHTTKLKMAGKKTKGRVKIKMEFIDNKLRRYTTFSKRKAGLMKKAYELSTLTGTEVMLLVASETGHVYTFATRKLQPMITSEAGKALIQTCLNSPDLPLQGEGEDAGMDNGDGEPLEHRMHLAGRSSTGSVEEQEPDDDEDDALGSDDEDFMDDDDDSCSNGSGSGSGSASGSIRGVRNAAHFQSAVAPTVAPAIGLPSRLLNNPTLRETSGKSMPSQTRSTPVSAPNHMLLDSSSSTDYTTNENDETSTASSSQGPAHSATSLFYLDMSSISTPLVTPGAALQPSPAASPSIHSTHQESFYTVLTSREFPQR